MIVIPMAGQSSRFYNSGYTKPKYELQIRGKSVFSHVVESFKDYFDDEKFLFIINKKFDSRSFVEENLKKMNLSSYEIVELDRDTLGQAETVYKGIEYIDDAEELYIFNIDTFLTSFSKFNVDCDGYLEVFHDELGDNWSFAKVDLDNNVLEVAEKSRISNLCSNGLYYFKTMSLYREVFEYYQSNNIKSVNEYYIAPMYNYLINNKLNIKVRIVSRDNVIMCGTPEEYESLSSN
ncbi:glycosyltransferase family 2 protein [Halobacteriovorax sp. CON-3]|uniref:glycosyltransferase family 2 protein n=1 Tax=Halobacteriovorax sp. CON-3 TaxID=3157710 RepID=UPI003720CE82